ncbi:MAG: hypothetical protein ACR2PL_12055 [Dehalococcoidia bacterium]
MTSPSVALSSLLIARGSTWGRWAEAPAGRGLRPRQVEDRDLGHFDRDAANIRVYDGPLDHRVLGRRRRDKYNSVRRQRRYHCAF